MHYTEILQSLAILKKFQVFGKTHQFFLKNASFGSFEISYYLSCFLRQFCYNLATKNFQSRSETSNIGHFNNG